MTHRNAPRMKPPAVFGSSPERGGPRRPADHAGRPHPLERPADRGGARRNAGAGGSRGVADRRDLRARARDDLVRGGQGGRPQPGCSWASRCATEIGDAEAALAAAPHRVDHSTGRRATTIMRSSCTRATIAWVDGETRRPRCQPARLGRSRDARRRVRHRRRRRSASPRPMSAGVSAASACGITRSSALPRRGWPAGRCASCCRARACTASSAAAR